jgi:HEAT repeat protein
MTDNAQNFLRNLVNSLREGKLHAATIAYQQLEALTANPTQYGPAIGKLLVQLHDDYQTGILDAFALWLENYPSRELADIALDAVKPKLNKMRQWRRILRDIRLESVSRRIRSEVRGRDVSAATRSALELIQMSSHGQNRSHAARQIGAILGSLNVDRVRSEQVMAALESHPKNTGFGPDDIAAMRESYAAAQNSQSMSEVSQMEMQWDRMHTDAVVELMRFLPGRIATGQPGPEDEKKLLDAFQEVLAAWFSDSENLNFADVARLFSEFCPADERVTGPVEGIEDVAFLRMGFADKTCSVRALRKLGEHDRLVSLVLELARQPMELKSVERLVRLMGGLSSPRFAPFLAQLLENKKLERIEAAIVDALGRVGDPGSLKLLQTKLVEYCGARLIDPPLERKLSAVVAGLGRIARHPRTTLDERNAIVRHAFTVIPHQNRALGKMALQHFLTFNPSSLAADIQKQAIHHIIANLWSMDTQSKLAKGNPNQRTELGFREMLVDIIVNLGKHNLGPLLVEAETRVMQYSGAYFAMAEALGRIGDARALPFLERMLMNTFRADESAIPEHMRETFYDAARDAHVPIGRDKIAHAICYAIRKTCGKKGVELLIQFARRIQRKELDTPGPDTASFLGAILSGDSIPGLPPVDMSEGETLAPEFSEVDAESFDVAWEKEGEAEKRAPATRRDRQDEPTQSLIKDIRGGGLFKTRIERRISAIQEVAARRDPEAVQSLVETLDDMDVVVRAAAQTALRELINPFDKETIYHYSLSQFFEALRKAPETRRKAATEFLLQLNPERQPTQKIILKIVEGEKNENIRMTIAEAFRLSAEKRKAAAAAQSRILDVQMPDGASGDELAPGGGEKTILSNVDPRNMSASDKLELRKRYFADRQAWIKGGKQGPEPKPPAGVGF